MYKLKLPSLKSLWNPVETQLYNAWKYNRIQLKKMAVPMPYMLAAKYVTKFNRYTGANMTRNLAETGADNSISSIYMRRFKPNLVYFIARILAFSCLNSQWLWPVLCETPGLRKKNYSRQNITYTHVPASYWGGNILASGLIDCPHVGCLRLLHDPSIVLYLALGSHVIFVDANQHTFLGSVNNTKELYESKIYNVYCG